MKLYYRAIAQDGKTVRGLIEAKDVNEAADYIKKRQMVPIKIAADSKAGIEEFLPFLKRKPKNSELVFFTRQMASMLTSGLTLMQALNVLKGQVQNPAMDEIVSGLIASIEDGKQLSVALNNYPDTFTPIYIALIKAAESSGLLDKVLTRLADNLERQEKLKSTIKGALLYPIMVILMMFAVIVIMMIFVIPQLSVLYQNLNIPLPLPTQIIVGASSFFLKAWWLVGGIIIILSYYYRRWHKTEVGKRVIDTALLKLPIFGKLISQSIMVEFTRTFGLLVSTGTLVVDSLVKSADVVGNVNYKSAILLVSKRVEKGISMGDAMEASPLFPAIVVEMAKIGEQTGKLDESMERISQYYEREVGQTVKTLTTAMEPIIMIILAIGVGFLIISIITPIYNLISSIQ